MAHLEVFIELAIREGFFYYYCYINLCQRTTRKSRFTFPTTWILVMELRLSGLAARTYSH